MELKIELEAKLRGNYVPKLELGNEKTGLELGNEKTGLELGNEKKVQ